MLEQKPSVNIEMTKPSRAKDMNKSRQRKKDAGLVFFHGAWVSPELKLKLAALVKSSQPESPRE